METRELVRIQANQRVYHPKHGEGIYLGCSVICDTVEHYVLYDQYVSEIKHTNEEAGELQESAERI